MTLAWQESRAASKRQNQKICTRTWRIWRYCATFSNRKRRRPREKRKLVDAIDMDVRVDHFPVIGGNSDYANVGSVIWILQLLGPHLDFPDGTGVAVLQLRFDGFHFDVFENGFLESNGDRFV